MDYILKSKIKYIEGGAKQVKGIKRYQLPSIKQVSCKDVMYSTGNTANISSNLI